MTEDRTQRTGVGSIGRIVAIPAIVGALALGVLANCALAQESSPVAGMPRTAGIFGGGCDALASPVAFALDDVAIGDDDGRRPSGDPVGAVGAADVLVSVTQRNGARVDDVLGQPHAVAVAAADGTVVACGEIGGYLYENEDLYIGLRGQNGSGVAGIALIEGDDDDAELDVTIFLVTDAASGAATATS